MSAIVLSLLMAAGVPDGFERSGGDKACTVYTRERVGSPIKELLATGVLPVPAADLFALLHDLDSWDRFFPFVHTSTVLDRREGGALVAYQRSAMPFIADRDYVAVITPSTTTKAGRPVRYRSTWAATERAVTGRAKGPVDGVVRLADLEGYWELEVLGPSSTRVIYYLFADPGGALPAFLVNMASERALPQVFDALVEEVRRRARQSAAAQRRSVVAGDRR